MRLLIAGMAALVAVAFAAPSHAQEETLPAATPAPAPAAKPKAGTANCHKMKSASARKSCLKKAQAKSTKSTKPTKTAKKAKKTTPTPAPKQPDVGQLSAPAAAPVPAGEVLVPPLPQKTI